MKPIDPTPELDACLVDLDRADLAVRALYRRLAEDPDRAAECDVELREQRAKRLELAQRAGLAALSVWRASVASAEVDSASPPAAESDDSGSGPVGDAAPEGDPVVPPTPEPEDARPGVPKSTPCPASPPAPASDAQVAQWKEAVQSKGLGAPLGSSPSAQRPWGLNLHEMMSLLGPFDATLNDSFALVDELDALEEVATDERQKLWVRLPIEVQKHWLSHLVARTRAIREHPSSDTATDRLKKIRAVYPQWTRDYVPGHIHGLQLKHAPLRGTWANDAGDHWHALCEVIGQELPKTATAAPARKKKERAAVESEPPSPRPTGRSCRSFGGRPPSSSAAPRESRTEIASRST